MATYRDIDIPQVKGIKSMLTRIQAKITELENSSGVRHGILR